MARCRHRPQGRGFRIPNNKAGVDLIVDRMRRAEVGRVVIDAIGVYAWRFMLGLAEAGFAVGVVDPKRIRAFRPE